MIPQVVAIERGIAQTVIVLAITGLQDHDNQDQSEAEVFWKVIPQGVIVPYAYRLVAIVVS